MSCDTKICIFFYKNCASFLILLQLCSSCKDTEGRWGHLVVIWRVTDSSRHECDARIIHFKHFLIKQKNILIYFMVSKSVAHLFWVFSAATCTRQQEGIQAAPTVVHATFTLHSNGVALIRGTVAGRSFSETNPLLLTIDHYSVIFVF